MLDIKRVREDPDPFRPALAAAGPGGAPSTSCWPPTSAAGPSRTRVEELRAEQNRASKAIGGAYGEEKQQLIAEVASVSAELKELEPQLAKAEGGAQRLARRHAERAARERTRRVHRRGRHRGAASPRAAAFDFEPSDHAELGAVLGCPRHRARRANERVAVRLPAGRPRVRPVRVDAPRDGHPRRQGVRAGRSRPCSCARKRCTAPACCRPMRSTSTRRPRTTSTWSARRRCRSRRSTMGEILDEADLPLRYAGTHLLPSRGRHVRQGHRRHVPRAPVRQGGDVRFATPESSWDEHEFLVGSRRRSSATSRSPTAW